MRIYSKEEWASIPWQNTAEGKQQRAHLEPFLRDGISTHIENVDVQLYVMQLDDQLIPFTVGEKGYTDSYVTSIYSLLLYAEEEMRRHLSPPLRWLLLPFLTFLKGWLRFTKINQTVIINNYLLSTNLYSAITPFQAEQIITALKKHYPGHTLLWRSLNFATEKELSTALHKQGAHLITSRSIYLYDPESHPTLPAKMRWNIKNDLGLIKNKKFSLLRHEDFQPHDAKRIKELYDLLYMEKYSKYNPAFTENFFRAAIMEKSFILTGLRRDGELVGVVGYFKKKGIFATPIVGYDMHLPKELGIYRALMALMIEHALEANTLFHMSSGVGHFKRKRGGVQEIESMAVFYDHLPRRRQQFWKLLKFVLNKFGAPILKKRKL